MGLLTVALILGLLRIAPALGLIDIPGSTVRKFHDGSPALVGGIAIFVALFFTLTLFKPDLLFSNLALTMAAFLLVVTGAVDDRFDLRPLFKLIAQITAAFIVVFLGKIVLLSLGRILPGDKVLALGGFAVPFTVLAIVVLLNAWNMIDGLNGLCSGITLICLFWLMIVIAVQGTNTQALFLPGLLAIGIACFLPFNTGFFGRRPHALAFMGDAGSLFLGLCMAWIPLKLTQDISFKIPPMVIAWILALPVFDMTCVCIKRIAAGKNPMAADKTHLHHLLIANGHSSSRTVEMICAMTLIYGGIGVLGWIWHWPQAVLFLLLVAALAGHAFLRIRLRRNAKT